MRPTATSLRRAGVATRASEGTTVTCGQAQTHTNQYRTQGEEAGGSQRDHPLSRAFSRQVLLTGDEAHAGLDWMKMGDTHRVVCGRAVTIAKVEARDDAR